MNALLLLSTLLAALAAHADSFPVRGAAADRLVNAFVKLGSDPIGTHEFFQAGVSGCEALYDVGGTYFPNGRPGDYVAESCLLYGSNADGSDEDGTLRVRVDIPADDRSLVRHPELAARLRDLRNLREAISALVVPLVKEEPVDGKPVVSAEIAGFAGLACDGRTSDGARICYVLPSSLCPPRGR